MRPVPKQRRARRSAAPRRAAPGPPKGKGTIRSLIRRGSRSDKAPRVARKIAYHDPTACEGCGAIYSRKTWRRPKVVDPELLVRASWAACPACRQVARGEFFGRVVIKELPADGTEGEVLSRVQNVADRAEFTQPERRIVEVRREGGLLEVHTTSQKLAHRIARELEKAFGGRVSFAWSDGDGALLATWEPPASSRPE